MDSANANSTAWGFNFFSPRSLRLMGALGKQHPPHKTAHLQTCQPRQNPSLQKSCFFCPRTRGLLLYQSFIEKTNLKTIIPLLLEL